MEVTIEDLMAIINKQVITIYMMEKEIARLNQENTKKTEKSDA